MTDVKQQRPVAPEDYFKLEYISEARLSPDGSKVLYGISSYNEEKDEDRNALWLHDIESGEHRQITAGNANDYNAAWSPDGEQVAFLSSRVEPPQIFILTLDGGEARQITSWEGAIVDGPVWSPDGNYLAFTASQKDTRDLSQPYRINRHIFRFNGIGYLDETLTDVYILPATGGNPRRLTKDNLLNSGPAWSPDGQEILFVASHHPHSFQVSAGLKTVDLDGNMHEIVTNSWGNVNSAVWTPKGSIVFSGHKRELPMGQKTDLWVVKRRGGAPECRTEKLIAEIGGGLQGDIPVYPRAPMQISKDSQKALVSAQKGGSVQIWEIALQGEENCRPLIAGDSTALLSGASEDQLLFVVSSFNDPINLFLADREGQQVKQMTHLNQGVIQNWLLPEVETLHFKGADGVEVEGYLMKPAAGEPPYPTVLCIHGGPTGAYGNVFSFDFQMLAGAGFAVMFNNPQGSTGYGSEYGLALNLRWGEIDYKDQMAGLDFGVEKGLVDPARLGVFGLSYGGYMTCWMITQTERFKAAVSENPVTDLASDYGVADASVWMNLDALGGHPHEVPECYTSASPVTFAHQCKTPTLMLQGEADYRCPTLNSEQFYTMLKANGCVVEMVRFPNSVHAASIMGDPIIRRAQNDELLAWMKKYV